MSYDRSEPFPINWNIWHTQWGEWFDAHAGHFLNTSWRFPAANFLADDRLGTWSVNGRNVELSEVTFPDLSRPGALANNYRNRYVGITFSTGAGAESALASTFAELEEALGIGEA
jgi:hypothetical protein